MSATFQWTARSCAFSELPDVAWCMQGRLVRIFKESRVRPPSLFYADLSGEAFLGGRVFRPTNMYSSSFFTKPMSELNAETVFSA